MDHEITMIDEVSNETELMDLFPPMNYNDSLQTDYNDSLQMDCDDAMADEVNHHSSSSETELMAPLFGHMQEEYESILSYACPDNLQRNVCDDKFCNEYKLCHDYQKKSELSFN